MIITIASGKGGTGKTTFAVNLAYALSHREQSVESSQRRAVRLLDCDVEEPNDHLFVRPDFAVEEPVSVPKPVWDAAACTACGHCVSVCNYNALALVKKKILIFNELCHSCGACSYLCPTGALTEKQVVIGKVQSTGDGAPFHFAHGLLQVGEALAPTVVNAVRRHQASEAITLIDAAPGTACSVVAAMQGADTVLLITEPTPFGLHDLKLAIHLTSKLRLPTAIIVNRSDGKDLLIAEYAAQAGVPIAGRIPFRRDYAEAYAEGAILIDRFPELNHNLLKIFDNLAPEIPNPPPMDDLKADNDHKITPRMGTATTTHQEVTIISGKGGTGKTTLSASLAQLAQQAVLADNDVDAADLHLLLTPVVREKHDFIGGIKATIDPEQCDGCGLCAEVCHFDAIHPQQNSAGKGKTVYLIDPVACEGCGLCPRICPQQAIASEDNVTGSWYVSDTVYGPMVHARLGIAEENSGRLVTQVREKAAALTSELRQELLLADGPPGTGCPVIASLTGTDLVVIVTEPTVSGVHDMERVMTLAKYFDVPFLVVINKADLNAEQAARIEQIAAAHNSAVIGHIPFDPMVNQALMAGKTVLDYGKSPAAEEIQKIWPKIQQALKTS